MITLPPREEKTMIYLVHGLDKLHSSNELHPPVALLPHQSVPVEVIHILNCGQEAGWVGLDDHLRTEDS